MAATNADKQDIANYIASTGAKITAHSGDPGTNGANQIGSSSGNTTWGSAAIVGSDAVVTGSAVPFTIPASTTVSHFGIWNGTTFRRGYALDASISVGASGSAPVDITPKIKYSG
ncbi:hypothetical protein KNU79_gp46 [Gordonia phage NadineRae]|uniref:Uncharacterized protein n=1 Tax=Gordonia phage NadineRae TaxID=2652882 RepID=A0A5P8DHL4_9CAUD|nr:hypothetical protein KNU79_gp46 [Gordonia phage NadineRae]QFP97730.1 hypothetical protein SEA_NADINERAE_46 [Gordonia phage NadineRae]